jgi:hypothetical protein
VKKSSTVAKRGNGIFRKPKLTIGLNLGRPNKPLLHLG